MALPQEPYKTEKATELFNKKDSDEVMKYLNSYFYKVMNPPSILFWDYVSGDFATYKIDDVVKYLIPNMKKDINVKKVNPDNKNEYELIKMKVKLNDYWCENTPFYVRTVNVFRPIFFEYKQMKHINTFLGLNKNLNRTLKEMKQETQDGVKFIWNHIKQILCSNDEKAYEYVHNWICNAVCFKSNETALYFRSTQGTGKSSITNFITKKVLSDKIAYTTENSDVLTGWNSVLEGKVLLVIEEMKSANTNEWALYSAALKTLITEPEITIKEKYISNHNVKNYLNIIINTNKHAIKLEGTDRRYFVADVSDKRYGDTEYFNELHGYLQKKAVALGFYRYCHENRNPK